MPHRMHGSDWYHLYEESRTEPKHTLKVLVLQPGDDGFDRAAAHRFAERLANLPEMRWVVAPMPRDLAPAEWIDRGRPDVEAHLEHRTLPEPTETAFASCLGELLARHLPRDRPLWRLSFVDGLEGGRVALVLALHHALADGTASARIIEAVVDRGEAAERDLAAGVEPEPMPDLRTQATTVARHHAHQVVSTPRLVVRSLTSAARVVRHRRATGESPQRRFDGPITPLAVPLTAGRIYAQTEVPLDDLKRVRKAHDASVNDVYMAVVGRAVHRFLDELGHDPGEQLTANVPVSVRPADDTTRHGNHIRNWNVGLVSHEPDPLVRLRAICDQSRVLRAERDVIDEQLLRDWFGRYGAARHLTRTLVGVEAKRSGRTPINLVVSNVPGPRSPMTVEGTKVVGLRSASVLIPHHALNATAWSYCDTVSMGFTACAGVFDSLERLTELAREELGAIVATT